MVWGSLISAGSSLLGGALGRRHQKSAERRAWDRQKEWATYNLQWKKWDAEQAGIHPIYAMGNPGQSMSPISVGGDPMGPALAAAGQDIGRAVDAAMTQKGRKMTQERKLNLERMGLENELLRSKIARSKAPQLPPPLPPHHSVSADPALNSDAAAAGVVVDTPMQRTASGAKRSQEPGAVPEVGFARTPTGLVPVPSKDFKERSEDNLGAEFGWSLRNQLLPSIPFVGRSILNPPPKAWLPKGYNEWTFNQFKQEWQPRKVIRHKKRDRGKPRGFNFRGGKQYVPAFRYKRKEK